MFELEKTKYANIFNIEHIKNILNLKMSKLNLDQLYSIYYDLKNEFKLITQELHILSEKYKKSIENNDFYKCQKICDLKNKIIAYNGEITKKLLIIVETIETKEKRRKNNLDYLYESFELDNKLNNLYEGIISKGIKKKLTKPIRNMKASIMKKNRRISDAARKKHNNLINSSIKKRNNLNKKFEINQAIEKKYHDNKINNMKGPFKNFRKKRATKKFEKNKLKRLTKHNKKMTNILNNDLKEINKSQIKRRKTNNKLGTKHRN